MRKQLTICTALLLLLAAALPAQRTLGYDNSVVNQVRIDMRELGYPPIDVIPSEESAVRALTIAPNGTLYGVTGGRRSHLFSLFPVHGYVVPLGFLNGVKTMYNSLVVSRSGDVYVGSGDPDGHLFMYSTARDERKAIRMDVAAETKDLVSYSIEGAKFTVHGKVAERKVPGEKFENYKNIGRAIAVDASGFAWISGEDAAIYKFRPGEQRLEKLPFTAPTVLGREPYNRVDTWAFDPCGTLYGGASDGYLFRIDPKSMVLENLGKPLNQYRMRGLVFSKNGKLYGVGGDDDEMARLFSYDPARGSYEMLGMVDVNRRPFYSWQAYVVDAMAIGANDTIYMGQSERKSKLYLYFPEPTGNAFSCEENE